MLLYKMGEERVKLVRKKTRHLAVTRFLWLSLAVQTPAMQLSACCA